MLFKLRESNIAVSNRLQIARQERLNITPFLICAIRMSALMQVNRNLQVAFSVPNSVEDANHSAKLAMHRSLVVGNNAIAFERGAYWQSNVGKGGHRRSHKDISASDKLDFTEGLVPALRLSRHASKRIRVQDVRKLYALRTTSFKAFQDDVGMGRISNGGKRWVYIMTNTDFRFAGVLLNG